jgi:hypothetical protein
MAYAADCTFFVEDDNMGPQVSRVSAKDQAKMIARARQDMISNELSRLAHDEYLEDIMEHVRQMEEETLPDANLIDMQREIQWFMRPYLIDFLIEAHAAFALLPETLFLTVNLLDRYCSRRVVYKQHYQLVGCAALLIAAKYGDKKDRVPQIHELNNMCCGLYDAGMFVQMEMHVLNTLEWNVGHPTVDFFAKLMATEEGDSTEVQHMAMYLAEIALYHRDFVSVKPSVIARASLTLARAILGRPDAVDGDWERDENNILVALSQVLHQPSVTLSRKYSSPHFSRVSGLLSDFLAQQAAIARQKAAMAQSAVAAPPSPPSEMTGSSRHSNVYGTPQKGHGAAAGPADGYLTPPITPDGYMASQQRDGYPVPRCPVTPTPQHGVYGYQSSHSAQFATGHSSHAMQQ